MTKEQLKKTTIIGYILILISIVTLLIQSIKPIDLIKILGVFLAIFYVVGFELTKLPLYQYTKKNEQEVKKYMKMAIIPDIPLYILMIVVLTMGYSGGHYLDRTQYGVFITLLYLIVYSIKWIIIVLPCSILHCIGFFQLTKIKQKK